MFAEQLSVYFADFGVTCAAGSFTFTAILDQPDQGLGMGGVSVLSTMYALTARTSDVQAAGLASGATVTVAGQAYTVRDVLQLDDGAITSLTLSK